MFTQADKKKNRPRQFSVISQTFHPILDCFGHIKFQLKPIIIMLKKKLEKKRKVNYHRTERKKACALQEIQNYSVNLWATTKVLSVELAIAIIKLN